MHKPDYARIYSILRYPQRGFKKIMRSLPKNLVYSVASRAALNFAAMAFLGVTLFVVWQNDAWKYLFQWKGLLFVLCGLLFCGIVIGGALVWMHQLLAQWVAMRSNSKFTSQSATLIRWSGTAVLLAQLLAVYYLTIWAIDQWLFTLPASP